MDTSDVETLSPIKQFLLTFLMPEKCYDKFFVDINFMHVPCWKVVLSKTAGIWILLGTVLGQIPQVWKVLRTRSAEGLSLTSVLLQLYAVSGPVVYCIANNFPISAWSERVFTLFQTMVIVFLILHYRSNTAKGVLLVLAYCGAVTLLVSSPTPPSVISWMQASSVWAVVSSKAVQVWTNHCRGNTGQLSGLSLLLGLVSSVAQIFTSLQETGQSLTTLSHVGSVCLSTLLLTQLLLYRNSSTSIREKTE